MPICVAGMHCSGTSMVATILRAFGVDLGPEREHPPGFGNDDRWTNGRFVTINDRVLGALDAAWDSPPTRNGWAAQPELEPLRRDAAVLSEALALAEPWGWEDPRNSLTLPFWRTLFPDLRVVVCVRHPVEVACLLEATGAASASRAFELWSAYYAELAALRDDEKVLTHFARYREDPKGEVVRIADELGLSPSRTEVARIAAMLSHGSVEHSVSDEPEVPAGVRDLYTDLIDAIPKPARPSSDSLFVEDGIELPQREDPRNAETEVAASQQRELEHLRHELARLRGHIEALQTQVDVRSGSDSDLRDVLRNVEAQLLDRDEELTRARNETEWRQGIEAALREEVGWRRRNEEALREKLDLVEQTQLWRLGMRYRSLKRLLREPSRRASP